MTPRETDALIGQIAEIVMHGTRTVYSDTGQRVAREILALPAIAEPLQKVSSQEFFELCANTPLMRQVMDERDALRAEVERLKAEGTPGVMHEVDKAFYDLAIRERDYARAQVVRLERSLSTRDSGL